MMYVIYNNDGSIKYKLLNEFVTQGNNNVNEILVAIADKTPAQYTLAAFFKLPNGDTTTAVSSETTESVEVKGETYEGNVIKLSSAETLLPGVLQVTIEAHDTNTDKVLVGFSTYITINKSGIQPSDPVIMTKEEYTHLLELVGEQVSQYETIYKVASETDMGDLDNWEVGQAFYVSNNSTNQLKEVSEGSNNHNTSKVIFDFNDHYNKSHIDSIDDRVEDVEEIIPSEASTSNKLADKNWTLSKINETASYRIDKNASGDSFATHSELANATTFYNGGSLRTPTRNDYCYVLADENHQNATTKYSWQGGTYPTGQWEFEVVVNETPMTQAQLNAINSGITASKVQEFSAKQDAIADLSAIRSGAALGSTALQEVPNTYRTKAAQDEIDSEIRNIAMGKNKTYIFPTTLIPTSFAELKTALNNILGTNKAFLIKLDDNGKVTTTDITQDVKDGEYDDRGVYTFEISNDKLKTNNNLVDISGSSSPALVQRKYLIRSEGVDFSFDTNFYLYAMGSNVFNVGDDILIIEDTTDTPDRWVGERTDNGIKLYAYASKEHSYTKAESDARYPQLETANDFSAETQTFGKVADENGNEASMGKIIAVIGSSSQDTSSTTFSGALASGIEKEFAQPLTSISISVLENVEDDTLPQWTMHFIAGNGLTGITAPTGKTFETPFGLTFESGVEYRVVITKMLTANTYSVVAIELGE